MKKKTKISEKQPKQGKKMVEKAGRAMKEGFYLEAAWILSAIFENKIRNLFWKLENQKPGAGLSLEQCIKRLKYMHVTGKYPLLTTHISIRLVDEIRNWKNQRNTIMKDMLHVHVSMVRVEKLSLEGIELLKKWNLAGKKIKDELKKSNLPPPLL